MEFEVYRKDPSPSDRRGTDDSGGATHSARNIGASTAQWLYGYNRGVVVVVQDPGGTRAPCLRCGRPPINISVFNDPEFYGNAARLLAES